MFYDKLYVQKLTLNDLCQTSTIFIISAYSFIRLHVLARSRYRVLHMKSFLEGQGLISPPSPLPPTEICWILSYFFIVTFLVSHKNEFFLVKGSTFHICESLKGRKRGCSLPKRIEKFLFVRDYSTHIIEKALR